MSQTISHLTAGKHLQKSQLAALVNTAPADNPASFGALLALQMGNGAAPAPESRNIGETPSQAQPASQPGDLLGAILLQKTDIPTDNATLRQPAAPRAELKPEHSVDAAREQLAPNVAARPFPTGQAVSAETRITSATDAPQTVQTGGLSSLAERKESRDRASGATATNSDPAQESGAPADIAAMTGIPVIQAASPTATVAFREQTVARDAAAMPVSAPASPRTSPDNAAPGAAARPYAMKADATDAGSPVRAAIADSATVQTSPARRADAPILQMATQPAARDTATAQFRDPAAAKPSVGTPNGAEPVAVKTIAPDTGVRAAIADSATMQTSPARQADAPTLQMATQPAARDTATAQSRDPAAAKPSVETPNGAEPVAVKAAAPDAGMTGVRAANSDSATMQTAPAQPADTGARSEPVAPQSAPPATVRGYEATPLAAAQAASLVGVRTSGVEARPARAEAQSPLSSPAPLAGATEVTGDAPLTAPRMSSPGPATDSAAHQTATAAPVADAPAVFSPPGATQLPGQPTQLTLATPLSQPGWQYEFNEKVVWVATQNLQSAELHLNPPQLGPLDVVISVSGDQASAQFSSPHAAVREAIEQSLPKLREMMADNGITLGNATVSDQGRQGNRDAYSARPQPTPPTMGEVSDNMEAGVQQPVPSTPVGRQKGMLDTFA